MDLTRREILAGGALLLAGAGAAMTTLPARAAFENARDAMRAVLGDVAPQTGRIALQLAKIVEDGSSVPVTISVDSPMTEADHVTRVHLFPDKNPTPIAATFRLGSRCGKAEISTRIRLAESQTIFAVAEMSDGSVWMTRDDVIVTIGGCGIATSDAASEAPVKTRIKLPKSAENGEVIQVKTLVTHPMESGHRMSPTGAPAPRKIINSFTCLYDGQEVFGADFHPSIAANPKLFFHIVASHSGTLILKWVDDDGSEYSEIAEIEVA